MPYLGDFLGHLLSEITMSRVQADLEALRLAELYANDPILKHFPIPRFRLPAVTVRVPVAVQEMEQPAEGEAPRGTIEPGEIKPAVDRAIGDLLTRYDVRLSRTARTSVDRAVAVRLADVGEVPEVSGGVTRIAADVAIAATGSIVEASPVLSADPERATTFQSELRERLTAELLRIRRPPPRLSVLVTAGELREAGENVVNFELSISEDAVVWTEMETAGVKRSKLVEE